MLYIRFPENSDINFGFWGDDVEGVHLKTHDWEPGLSNARLSL